MRIAFGLLLLVAAASAEPAVISSPPRICTPSGGALFEVAQRADPKRKLVTATTKLYGNGAWRTQVIDVDRKLMRTTSGCLDRIEIEGIREDLKSATWKITRAEVSCQTYSPRFTVYKWNGRTLHTERTCSTKILEQSSQQVLERIKIWLRVPEDLDGARDAAMRLPPLLECADTPLVKGCM